MSEKWDFSESWVVIISVDIFLSYRSKRRRKNPSSKVVIRKTALLRTVENHSGLNSRAKENLDAQIFSVVDF